MSGKGAKALRRFSRKLGEQGSLGLRGRRQRPRPRVVFVRADPVPVITAVVMAVGFLGAGTIIRRADGEHVEGLTTAAAMLFAAAVGSAVGLRQFVLAIGAAILAVGTLRGVLLLENRLRRRGPDSPRRLSG
jgi:uncharacterized membrane protein YhiD involved in acid resistance